MNAAKFLTILRPKGGGAPPAATWDSVLTSYSPAHRFNLTEASGNFTNTGSVGNLGTAQGTPTYQAGSLIAPSTGIGVESGDGWNFSGNPAQGNCTVIVLVRPPASLATVNLVNTGGSSLFFRILNTGALQMYDDLDFITVTSSAGVVNPDEWNLMFYQPLITGTSAIYHTSESDAGAVSSVATGSAFTAQVEGSTAVRGSANADTAVIGSLAIVPGGLTLGQMQALADTLTWA